MRDLTVGELLGDLLGKLKNRQGNSWGRRGSWWSTLLDILLSPLKLAALSSNVTHDTAVVAADRRTTRCTRLGS